ncbi:CLUMA_CG016882, isoform A [Clunio marinus]|uniref:CLUMA_CG016882, isoform A n=1 Tax=Clunio marinus TaxID=568069 RepID=A0A1J1IT89_9DIPT|nr:CLUMA_CG016882, isoform A [Clunio marinus]
MTSEGGCFLLSFDIALKDVKVPLKVRLHHHRTVNLITELNFNWKSCLKDEPKGYQTIKRKLKFPEDFLFKADKEEKESSSVR